VKKVPLWTQDSAYTLNKTHRSHPLHTFHILQAWQQCLFIYLTWPPRASLPHLHQATPHAARSGRGSAPRTLRTLHTAHGAYCDAHHTCTATRAGIGPLPFAARRLRTHTRPRARTAAQHAPATPPAARTTPHHTCACAGLGGRGQADLFSVRGADLVITSLPATLLRTK